MSGLVPPRRGFLRGLATLPLIGCDVTLIGQATAAAVPVTKGAAVRIRLVLLVGMIDANKKKNLAEHFDMPRVAWVDDKRRPGDAKRNAAVVLSAVGGWRP